MKVLKEKGNVTLTEFPHNMGEKYRVMKSNGTNVITYHLNLADAERKFEVVSA